MAQIFGISFFGSLSGLLWAVGYYAPKIYTSIFSLYPFIFILENNKDAGNHQVSRGIHILQFWSNQLKHALSLCENWCILLGIL